MSLLASAYLIVLDGKGLAYVPVRNCGLQTAAMGYFGLWYRCVVL